MTIFNWPSATHIALVLYRVADQAGVGVVQMLRAGVYMGARASTPVLVLTALDICLSLSIIQFLPLDASINPHSLSGLYYYFS